MKPDLETHTTGDDIAALCIFAIGAIAIGLLMWYPTILEDIATAIINYVRIHQTA